jgi:hypothetical protein
MGEVIGIIAGYQNEHEMHVEGEKKIRDHTNKIKQLKTNFQFSSTCKITMDRGSRNKGSQGKQNYIKEG